MNTQHALVLFGGVSVIKYPLFLTTLCEKGIHILLVDEFNATVEKQLAKSEQEPHHIFRKFKELFFTKNGDKSAILQQLAHWSRSYNLIGVYCIKEIFVEDAGLAADFLGLKSPGLRASIVCRNKYYQRLYLPEWSPQVVCINPERREEIIESFRDFPAVLKPVGRHSSSGVQLVTESSMLRACLKSYPEQEVLLLETQILGREFSVETLVQNGSILFQNITQKGTNEDSTSFFVEMSHTLPATNLSAAESEALLQANEAILRRLDFQDGISHGEYRVTDQGDVYLMEIAARNPGDAVKLLYYLATHQEMEPQLLNIAMGVPAAYAPLKRYARQFFLVHEPGYLQDVIVDGYDQIEPIWFPEKSMRTMPVLGPIDEPAAVREIMVLRKRGDLLREVSSSQERCVSVLIDANTPEELDALEQQVRDRITIVTSPVAPSESAR